MSDLLRCQRISAKRQAGFTLLELTVVIVVISVLFLFAYESYLKLLVDVEKASVEQTVGILRSAVGMQVAKAVIEGKIEELKSYDGKNPVDFLAEVPQNYAGEMASEQALNGRTGLWYFDRQTGLLIYQVKHKDSFFSAIDGFHQARFRLAVVYDKRNASGLAGLSLKPVESFSWFKKR